MGMFDKDKEIGRRVDVEFADRQPFILWGAMVEDEPVDTEIGPARKTILIVSRMDAPAEQFECTTLASAIADKAEKAETDDFPAVVELLHVPGRYKNEALVLQFVKPYDAQRARARA